MTNAQIAELVQKTVAESIKEAIPAILAAVKPNTLPTAETHVRHVVLQKKDGTEKATTVERSNNPFNALTDKQLDEYCMLVYATRDKDAGVFFYGAAPMWSLMLRRAYRHSKFSDKQFAWIRKLLGNDSRNAACLSDRYPKIHAEFLAKKLDPQEIIDASDKARRERKAL